MIKKAIQRWLGILPFSPVATVTDAENSPVPRSRLTRPTHLQFEDDDASDFGTQVAMLLALQPDAWSIHESLRAFSHPELGLFEFDSDDRVQHRGIEATPNYGRSMPGRQRALTRGDHEQISDALRHLLKRPMEIGTKVADSGSVQVYHGARPTAARKGDVYIDGSNQYFIHDGSQWVPQTDKRPTGVNSLLSDMQMTQQLANKANAAIDAQITQQFADVLKSRQTDALRYFESGSVLSYVKPSKD